MQILLLLGRDYLSLNAHAPNPNQREELLNFRSSVENNADYILNYYQQYATNAIAESTNARIQGYIRDNKGTRDIDFFHYRLGLVL